MLAGPWELMNLMLDLESMFERLKKNEEIGRKFHILEARIISILNFKDFFEKLLTEMMAVFHIPCVWMSVIKESQLAGLISRIYDSDIIRKRTNFISADEFNDIIGRLTTPVLVNEDLTAYASFFPEDMICSLGSLAITPVVIDGEIAGSLNQWDFSPSRFEPDMDTSFLEQLTLKISLCLSNVSAHEKLQFFAYHDPLTGLLNRRAFEEVLQREFSRSRRHGAPLSLVYLDLDSFKQINDSYGHDIGDYALKHVAYALESHSRREDIVSRLAGDEFVIMLPEAADGAAEALMVRISDYLSRHPVAIRGTNLPVSISCGISSTVDRRIKNPDHLMQTADERLYAAKRFKKNTQMKNQDVCFSVSRTDCVEYSST
jgi:diguanylate cyclase (GGDEF)-like protein